MANNYNGQNNIQNEEKIPYVDPKFNSPLFKKVDNFFYHYKWAIIIIAFFIITFSLATGQFISKQKVDMSVMYAGPLKLTLSHVQNITSSFEKFDSSDVNEDSNNVIDLIPINIFSTAQIAEIQEGLESGERIDAGYYSDELKKFNNLLITAESFIMLIDEEMFNTVVKNQGIVPLKDYITNIPESAVGEYGIRLSELSIVNEFDGLKLLPEGTILCLRRNTSFTQIISKSKEKEYNKAIALINEFISYIASETTAVETTVVQQ